MSQLYDHFISGFRGAVASREFSERRIGAELKFPLVNRDGTAAALDELLALWHHLAENGWEAIQDPVTGQIAGATSPGPYNDTVASCETGYCKTEFSLAHVGSLFELSAAIAALRRELTSFSRQRDVQFLGYGIQQIGRAHV